MNGSSFNTLITRNGKANYVMLHWVPLVRLSACWMMELWLLEPHDLPHRDTYHNLMPIWGNTFQESER